MCFIYYDAMSLWRTDAFNEVMNEIKKIKEGFWTELWGQIRYTQDNIAHIFNVEKNQTITAKAIETYEACVIEASNALDQIKQWIEAKTRMVSDDEKRILMNNIEHLWWQFKFLSHACWLEAETWWYKLEKEQRNLHKQAAEKCMDYIYGPKVSDVPAERDRVLGMLLMLHEKLKNDKEILLEDQEFLDKKLNELTVEYWNWKYEEYKAEYADFRNKEEPIVLPTSEIGVIWAQLLSLQSDKSTFLVLPKESDWPEIEEKDVWWNKQLCLYYPRGQIASGAWKSLAEAYLIENNLWDPQTCQRVVIDPKATNCVVSENVVKVYWSRNKFVWKMLALFDHEVWTHMQRSKNKITMRDYQTIEEGIALFNQRLMTEWIDEIDMRPSEHHIWMFLAENFSREDCEKLMWLLWYHGEKWKEMKTALKLWKSRVERMFRFWGLSRKDVVYYRGFLRVVEEIKRFEKWRDDKNVKQRNIPDLRSLVQKVYVGKVGEQFLTDYPNLVDQLVEQVANQQTVWPTMWWKVLMSMLYPEYANRKDSDDPRMQIHIWGQNLAKEKNYAMLKKVSKKMLKLRDYIKEKIEEENKNN